jgi:hypothetical protein
LKIDWKTRQIKFDRDSWSSVISLNNISLGDFKEKEFKECSSNSPLDTLNNRDTRKNMKKKVTWKDEMMGLGEEERECSQGEKLLKECSSNSRDTRLTSSETGIEDDEKDKSKRECSQGEKLLMECSSNSLDAVLTSSEIGKENDEEEEHRKSMKVFERYYADFRSLFEEKELDSMPPNRACDMEINLVDDSKIPPFLKIFRLTLKEEDLLKDWIDSNLEKGFIRPSKSPCAAPIFFVPKKDGDLRPCINYKRLNENTLPDGRPLPLISDILSQFHGAEIFSC